MRGFVHVCVQCVSDCACVCFCILSFIHSFNHFMFIILELACFIESHLGLDWYPYDSRRWNLCVVTVNQ